MYRLVQTCQISETLLLCFQQRAQSPRLLWNLFNWACNKPSDAPRLLVIHGYDIIVHTYSKTARSWSKSIKEQRIVIISVSNPSRAVAVERKIRGASSARARGWGRSPFTKKKCGLIRGDAHTQREIETEFRQGEHNEVILPLDEKKVAQISARLPMDSSSTAISSLNIVDPTRSTFLFLSLFFHKNLLLFLYYRTGL